MKAFFAVAVAAVLASAVSAQSVQLETFSTNSDCSSPMSYLYETLSGACVTSPCTALPLTNFYVELSCPTSYPTAAPSGFGGQVSFSNTSCDPTQANLATFLKTGVCASFGSGSYFLSSCGATSYTQYSTNNCTGPTTSTNVSSIGVCASVGVDGVYTSSLTLCSAASLTSASILAILIAVATFLAVSL